MVSPYREGACKMARRTVGELYVDLIARAGVRRLYGVVGDSLNPVVDAVRRNRAVEWVQVRHEEVAAFAAGGLGALARRAGGRPRNDAAAGVPGGGWWGGGGGGGGG